MSHHVRQNPLKTNQLGLPNSDTIGLPEFTFHHGHVIKVVNDARDLDGYGVSNIPKDVSHTSNCFNYSSKRLGLFFLKENYINIDSLTIYGY